MELYKVFDTEQEAKDYSHAKAVMRGHGKPESTIQYWWAWRETKDGRWAVQCPEGTESEPKWSEVNNDN